MSKNDNIFNITMILMTLFSSLESVRDENDVELIYDVDPTVPKELKGNSEALLHLLIQILTFVFQNTDKDEILLSITAPEDFLYEELVTFSIIDTGINQEKLKSFIETRLPENLKMLNASILESVNNPSDIIVSMPLKVEDIGNRRHYRLPDISMLGKKVLLLCDKGKVAYSIKKMFQYFLYEVDSGLDAYTKNGSNLSRYDIVVISESMTTPKLETLIGKVQQKSSLKYVIVQSSNVVGTRQRSVETAYLIKPAMQESIYELIISLFKDEVEARIIKPTIVHTVIDMGKYINFPLKIEEEKYIYSTKKAQKKAPHHKDEKNDMIPILDTQSGLKNAQAVGMDYRMKLQKFLDDFKKSDIFFRQIVNEKSIWKTKEFLIDLEKESRFIGALRLAALAEKASLLFVYDKLNDLPLYVRKYHLELKRVVDEIEKFIDDFK
jgi:ribosomal protein L7Ae-like RNA K-turn-binding protein